MKINKLMRNSYSGSKDHKNFLAEMNNAEDIFLIDVFGSGKFYLSVLASRDKATIHFLGESDKLLQYMMNSKSVIHLSCEQFTKRYDKLFKDVWLIFPGEHTNMFLKAIPYVAKTLNQFGHIRFGISKNIGKLTKPITNILGRHGYYTI